MAPTISPPSSPILSYLDKDTDLTLILSLKTSRLRAILEDKMENLDLPRYTTTKKYLIALVVLLELELIESGDEPNKEFVNLVGWLCQSRKPLLMQDIEGEEIDIMGKTRMSKSEMVKLLIDPEWVMLENGASVLLTLESPTASSADSRPATPPPTITKAKPTLVSKKATATQKKTFHSSAEMGTPVSAKPRKKKVAFTRASGKETARGKKTD